MNFKIGDIVEVNNMLENPYMVINVTPDDCTIFSVTSSAYSINRYEAGSVLIDPYLHDEIYFRNNVKMGSQNLADMTMKSPLPYIQPGDYVKKENFEDEYYVVSYSFIQPFHEFTGKCYCLCENLRTHVKRWENIRNFQYKKVTTKIGYLKSTKWIKT